MVVTLSDDAPGTATAKVTSTANVINSSMAATANNIAPTEHTAFSGAVATFKLADFRRAVDAAAMMQSLDLTAVVP